MKRYHLELSTVRFLGEGANNTPNRRFDAPDDAAAIQHSEHPEIPLKVIWDGDAVSTVPRKLWDITEAPRVVKEWF